MRFPRDFAASAIFLCFLGGTALGQADWEFLGPDFGYLPEAFFVSERAIYLGLSVDDETGLGLYRYPFDGQEWELFACDGFQVTGVTVWGDADENILLIRVGPGGDSKMMRSTDGGDTWVVTWESDYERHGLNQAPSDTARVIMTRSPWYSTDGGWTWRYPGGAPLNGASGVCFDPSDELVAYLSGTDAFGFGVMYKSINGGANWGTAYWPSHQNWGIEVERATTEHVMGGTAWTNVIVTTNAGETWSEPEAPFRTKPLHCAPWLPGTFFVAGSSSDDSVYEVWRTGDLGETWYRCGDNLPDKPEGYLLWTKIHLEGHPTEPILYAAFEGAGVWSWDVREATTVGGGAGMDARSRLVVYPVPTSHRLGCRVSLSAPGHVFLRLFDVSGRLVRTLRQEHLPAGTHAFDFSAFRSGGPRMPSGVYTLRLDTGGRMETRKVIILD